MTPFATDLTLPGMLRAAAARDPEKVAIFCGAEQRTFAELAANMAAVAGRCRKLGLSRSDIAIVAAGTRIEYFEVVAGIGACAAAAATINPRMTAPEALAIAADSRARLAFLDQSADHLALPLAEAGVHVLRIPDDLQNPAAALAGPGPTETDAFAVSYTSGTTGAPKGVLLSHRSRALSALAMAGEYGCFGPTHVFLAVTPLFHGAGLAYPLANLLFGGTVILEARADPETLSRRLKEGGFTGVFVVPTILKRLLDLPPKETPRPGDLKSVICNAAALPQALKQAFAARFGAGLLHETYGSTEAGIVTNLGPDDLLTTEESCGRPFPGVEVSIRRADGREAEPGEVGELFSRSLYGFNGYLHRPAETAETVRDGWIGVGDLAMRDARGFLHIVGRKKDVIITGGINVYPREIEAVLECAAGVAEAAVIGVADPDWGERVVALIVAADPERPPDGAVLNAACRAALAPHKTPRSFRLIASVPRTASGKTQRKELAALSATAREI